MKFKSHFKPAEVQIALCWFQFSCWHRLHMQSRKIKNRKKNRNNKKHEHLQDNNTKIKSHYHCPDIGIESADKSC